VRTTRAVEQTDARSDARTDARSGEQLFEEPQEQPQRDLDVPAFLRRLQF